MHSDVDLLLRILVGTVLAAVIGYERDLHGRPAGLRTHALVGLASATFMVVSTHFVYAQHYATGDLIGVDASRIAASVVSGIGFLAGGAILRTGLNIQGLTTAAGLWLVAAIGLAAGGGMYLTSVFATLLGIIALTILRRFEDKDDRLGHRRVIVTLAGEVSNSAALLTLLTEAGVRVTAQEYDRDVTADRLELTLDVRFPIVMHVEQLLRTIESHASVRRVRIVSAR